MFNVTVLRRCMVLLTLIVWSDDFLRSNLSCGDCAGVPWLNCSVERRLRWRNFIVSHVRAVAIFNPFMLTKIIECFLTVNFIASYLICDLLWCRCSLSIFDVDALTARPRRTHLLLFSFQHTSHTLIHSWLSEITLRNDLTAANLALPT